MTSSLFASAVALGVSIVVQGCQQATEEAVPSLVAPSPAAVSAQQPLNSESLQTAELMVEGTSCASCTVTIRRQLNQLTGVSDIREGQSKQHVMVDFDPELVSPEQIVQAVHDAGYEAEVLVYAKKS